MRPVFFFFFFFWGGGVFSAPSDATVVLVHVYFRTCSILGQIFKPTVKRTTYFYSNTVYRRHNVVLGWPKSDGEYSRDMLCTETLLLENCILFGKMP